MSGAGENKPLRRSARVAAAVVAGPLQNPVPPVQAGLQAQLDIVLAEQDDRARIARA